MEKFSKRVIVIVGILLMSSTLFLMFSSINDNREKDQNLKDLQQENVSLKSNVAKLSTKYNQLTEQYNSLNKEKNGSANESLLTTTNELFKTVYSYDTQKDSDSVAARKEKAKPYANTSTLDALFSKDPDKLTSTVTTVSKLEGEPEVYRMSSDEKSLTALVLINYSLTIAGSEKHDGKFMYKVVFDPTLKQITDVENIGEVNVP